jgi:hypothetical protein
MARLDVSADDAWTLTERFRVHAKEIALEHAYTFLGELRRKADLPQGVLSTDLREDLR